MFAKIFSQIYDSSIVENPELRFTFMDLLVLADAGGVVDMTHEAIARRTNRPIDVIRSTIEVLENPDTRSRTPDAEGRRLKRLDAHRDWGWVIINYDQFRKVETDEQRREKTLARVNKYRGKIREINPCNAGVTPANGELRVKRQGEEEAEAEEEVKEGERSSLSLSREVLEVWNKAADEKGLPQCIVLSDKRRRILQNRFNDPFFKGAWKQAIIKICESSFCRGENSRTWRASFDWFIQADVVAKVMEGKYDGKAAQKASNNAPRPSGPTDFD